MTETTLEQLPAPSYTKSLPSPRDLGIKLLEAPVRFHAGIAGMILKEDFSRWPESKRLKIAHLGKVGLKWYSETRGYLPQMRD